MNRNVYTLILQQDDETEDWCVYVKEYPFCKTLEWTRPDDALSEVWDVIETYEDGMSEDEK